jgi:hypothetical protein
MEGVNQKRLFVASCLALLVTMAIKKKRQKHKQLLKYFNGRFFRLFLCLCFRNYQLFPYLNVLEIKIMLHKNEIRLHSRFK